MTALQRFSACRKPLDLRLYLVLDPDLCERSAGIIETALAAAAAGAGIVQLRAPGWKKRRMAECARALKRALVPLGVPLIIDDHADVAAAADADGLHVGQEDLSPEDARSIIGPDRILGLSLGSLSDCSKARWDLIDYAGIGPVFATQTKKDAGAAIGTDSFAAICAAAPCPCVGIGGIDAGNAAQIAAAGGDGIAVISAICGKPDPERASEALLSAFLSGLPARLP